MIRILQTVMDEINDIVQNGYPNECCGIFGGDPAQNKVQQIVPAENLNKERSRDRYLMNPKDIVRAQKKFSGEGQDVLGYYHSHPDHPAKPSETDRVNAWSGYSYVIVSVMNGKVADARSWVLNEKTQQFEEEKIEVIKGDS